MQWTDAQRADVARHYTRIGYVQGELWPAPPGNLEPADVIALLKSIPDGAGREGYVAALAARGKPAPVNLIPNNELARAGINRVHGVRYQVTDVARAVAFYTRHLGFKLEHQQLPAFASVSLGDFTLLLSGPGASGSRPMPGGGAQKPGGWNRVVLQVTDLPAQIDVLMNSGLRFRNPMETGPGGRQIQVEDPDGNPIELFEPAR